MKPIDKIKIILYDALEKDNFLVQKFLKIKGKIFIEYEGPGSLDEHLLRLRNDGYDSKEVIILKKFMGRLFQKCPGSADVICCNYRLINFCFNCIFSCTYCYLNTYLNSFGIILFTNIDEVTADLEQGLDSLRRDRIYRIGTGEYTDSLMFDDIAGIGKLIIERLSVHKNILLELKTKSDNVYHLFDIPEKSNTVLAWSMNTERNISRYEKGSADLEHRLKAASGACEAGFFLAFHFDPIIIYPGWEAEYREVVGRIFSAVDPGKVLWISLGGFRYSPGFKDLLREKSPGEDLTTGEMFPGPDGKIRYFKKKRIDIYKKMREYINLYTDNPFIYLCMEKDYIWDEVFGKRYVSSEELETDFSSHLQKILRGTDFGAERL